MQLSLGVNLSDEAEPAPPWVHGLLLSGAAASILLLGVPILKGAWVGLRNRQVTMDHLFLLAIIGALAASLLRTVSGTGAVYYEVVSVLCAIHALGRIVISGTQTRAKEAFHTAMEGASVARVLQSDGSIEMVPSLSLKPGQRIVVPAGSEVPVDGEILQGEAFVQRKIHTGEPFPVSCSPGSEVLAGSRVLDGQITILATRAGSMREIDKQLARIEAGIAQATRFQREAGRWAAWFVPFVMGAAALTFLIGASRWGAELAFFNAMSVLLVACPCGLGIGLPTCLWTALGKLVRLGLVPRDPALVERLAGVTGVIFDKTGTLTDPDLTLGGVYVAAGVDRQSLLRDLSAIQSRSDHPVARPFHPLAALGAEIAEVTVRILPGRGIEATIEEDCGPRNVLVGSAAILTEDQKGLAQSLRRGAPVDRRELFVVRQGRLEALVTLEERVRREWKSIAARISKLGLGFSVMTGDDRIPEELQEGGRAGQVALSGREKADRVEALQSRGERELFVGDGRNDAEAICRAWAGLAIEGGDPGAAAVAHGVITDLVALPDTIQTCRAAIRRTRQILAFAFAYNLLGMSAAAMGLLNPIGAAVLMFCSSATVICLGSRLPAIPAGGRGDRTSRRRTTNADRTESVDVEPAAVNL